MGFNPEIQSSVYYICPLLEEEMVLCAVQVSMMRRMYKALLFMQCRMNWQQSLHPQCNMDLCICG